MDANKVSYYGVHEVSMEEVAKSLFLLHKIFITINSSPKWIEGLF